VLRIVGHHGPIPAAGTLPLTRVLPPARAILDRRTIHITDLLTETDESPEGRDRARSLSFRTILAVPLVHASEAIGVISIRRTEARPFSDKQIALLETFANQAVIAIENTRLFEEVQARNRELSVALEQQTATSELLKIIGGSAFDLQPVFDTLAEQAVRLCESERALIFRFNGTFLQLVATYNATLKLKQFIEHNPVVPGRNSATARAALERKTIQIPDIQSDPEYTYGASTPIRARELY